MKRKRFNREIKRQMDKNNLLAENDRLAKENEQLKEMLGSCDRCTTHVFQKCEHEGECLLKKRVRADVSKEMEKLKAELDRIAEDYRTALQDGLVTAAALEETIEERDRLREAITKHRDTFPDEALQGEFDLWEALNK